MECNGAVDHLLVFAALMVLEYPLAKEIGLLKGEFSFVLAAAGVGMVLGAAMWGMGRRFHHKPLPLVGFDYGFCVGVFSY